MKKLEVNNVDFELLGDPAPHQFAEPGDYIMIYKLLINDELVCSTDEGWDLDQMVKICEKGSKYLERVAKFLKKKKQLGDRCS